MNEEDYYKEKLSAELWDQKQTHQSEISRLVELEEFNLFSLLRPKIYIDGSRWCVLHGEDIQDGVCGFGATPREAVSDFTKAWDKRLTEN